MSQAQVKPTQEFFNYVNEFIGQELLDDIKNETKIECWNKMKTELEIAGFPQEMIGKTIKESIESKLWSTKYEKLGVPRDEFKWHSGHFYSWAKSQGITNFLWARHVKLDPVQDTSINTPIIQRLEKLSKIISIAKQKFVNTPGIDSKITKDQYEEWDTILQILEDSFNEKLKVPVYTEDLLLFRAASSASVTFAAEAFFEDRLIHLKKIKKTLTSKQIGYYQKNEIQLQRPLLKPKTRDEAIFQGYCGLNCETCNSLRVKEKTDVGDNGENLLCKDCNHSFRGYTVNKCRYCQLPLYKEELIHIIKTWEIDYSEYPKGDKSGGHCPECNTLNHLPEDIIDYADPDHKIRDKIGLS